MPGVGTIAPGGIGVLRTLAAPRTGSDGTATKGGAAVGAGESCTTPVLGSSAAKATTKKTANPTTRAHWRAVRHTLRLA
jgi:hypothetical protein